jgi:glycerol-3-phosphate cytidylyltransferase
VIVGIVGVGFVGSAVKATMENSYQVETFDIESSLSTTDSIKDLTDKCHLVFVCVPTPESKDGSVDTSIVESVLAAIGKAECAVVLKSTVPPGFTEAESKKLERDIIFNPEFLTAANAESDYANQNHTILGVTHTGGLTNDEYIATKIIGEALPHTVIIHTTHGVAEMTKYARNGFLATKVAFANEIWGACYALNIPYDEVREFMVMDPRIADSHLSVPGHDGKFGFGGACFPKDTKALHRVLNTLDVRSEVLEGVITSNSKVRDKVKGVTAGSFDLLHAGHLKLLEDAKNQCTHLIVLLQSDPTIDRPHKNKPVQTLDERLVQLEAVKFVDQIMVYDTEDDLFQLLSNIKPDIRIQGNDWVGTTYTGESLNIPIHYHDRKSHSFSSSSLRRRVIEAESPKLSE